MHGDIARSASREPAPRTPAAVIVAFRNEYRLPVERLAAFLGLDADCLREYEALGSAPPWVSYALLGVAYEQFGVEPADARGDVPAPPLFLPRASSGAGPAGAERAA